MEWITLGIGTPGGVSSFLLVGLSPSDAAVELDRPTVEPTLELLVVGSPEEWHDLTDDLVMEPLRWSRGLFGAGPLDLLARPGSLTWALDNTDDNGAGIPYLYSPGHANCLTGFRHGAIVRLKLSDGTNTRYVFRGRIRRIDRRLNRMSLHKVSIIGIPLRSRYSSSICASAPKSRRAARRASSAERPRARCSASRDSR